MENKPRTALVTGGNSGLGAATARALHDAGHSVIIAHTPNNPRAAKWLQEQERQGYGFTGMEVDVSDWESTQRLADGIHAKGMQVDILINNAGITRDATLRKLTKENWDAVLRTNLDSMFNMTQPLAGAMAERGWGRIINISSVNGTKGQFGQTNYSAAKAGIHGFTMALAQELARKGVTVNTVAPGYLATDMVMAMPEDTLNHIVSGIPAGRLGKPEEIAALIAFVASEAAAYMTGSKLSMNGGLHMY